MRHRDRADRAHVALHDPLLRLGPVLVQLELPRDDVRLPEPEDDLLVADVLALRRELDHVTGGSVDALLAAEARARVVLGPGDHLLEDVEVMVAEVRAHEALVARPGGDLPDTLELGKVEPLIGGAPFVGEGEEAGPLHLGGREKEEDRLLLVAGLAPVVKLHLAHTLAAAFVDDRELHLLVPVVPVARRVVERLSPVQYLAGSLGSRRAGCGEDEEGEREPASRWEGEGPSARSGAPAIPHCGTAALRRGPRVGARVAPKGPPPPIADVPSHSRRLITASRGVAQGNSLLTRGGGRGTRRGARSSRGLPRAGARRGRGTCTGGRRAP